MPKDTLDLLPVGATGQSMKVHKTEGSLISFDPIKNSVIISGADTNNNNFLSFKVGKKVPFDLELESIIVLLQSTQANQENDNLVLKIESEPDKIDYTFNLGVTNPQTNTVGLVHSGNFYTYEFPKGIVAPVSATISYNTSGIANGKGVILACKPAHLMFTGSFYKIS